MNNEHQPLASKRVLVVDDDSDILQLFSQILASDGWQVDCASNGDEAMLLYSLRNYDLVTLDWSMPGIGGKDIHQAISTHFGHGKRYSSMLPPRLPPILIVTGYFESEEVQEMVFAERVVGIVRKPISCEKLVELAHDLCEWETQRRERRAAALARLRENLLDSRSSGDTHTAWATGEAERAGADRNQ